MPQQIPQRLAKVIGRFSQPEQDLIVQAFLFAQTSHHGQKRKSGSVYLVHPLNIAVKLADDGYDAETVAAGLLHDVVEDCGIRCEAISKTFGIPIGQLVAGLTKIRQLRIKSKKLSTELLYLAQVDNYRQLLMAAASDIRVMVIRLYDRLDNTVTLSALAPEKQEFYAKETIEVFAPIAERLGMGEIKGQLEDYAFPFAYPIEYNKFVGLAKNAYQNPKRVVRQALPVIKKMLIENDIKVVSIDGRAKHLFSLYRKVQRGKNLNNVFDIVALRVILPTIGDCYKALGIIHAAYQPLPSKIKDYIARPKDNGYQSLHTTVKDRDGNVFEIQFRTPKMHEVAERGIAAHWSYKEQNEGKNRKILERVHKDWQSELSHLQGLTDEKDLIKHIRENVFNRQIFVFSPKGKIIRLPIGAIGLDFAYHIHTDLGNRCCGIKINDRIVPLHTTLNNGDVVEILTSPKASPSSDWLKMVITPTAKHHIKNELKLKHLDLWANTGEKVFREVVKKLRLPEIDNDRAEKQLRTSGLPYRSLRSAFAALTQGALNKMKLLRHLYPNFKPKEKRRAKTKVADGGTITTIAGIRHTFAQCCKPKPNQKDLVGYLSSDHIIKVHRKECSRLSNVDPNRLINL